MSIINPLMTICPLLAVFRCIYIYFLYIDGSISALPSWSQLVCLPDLTLFPLSLSFQEKNAFSKAIYVTVVIIINIINDIITILMIIKYKES